MPIWVSAGGHNLEAQIWEAVLWYELKRIRDNSLQWCRRLIQSRRGWDFDFWSGVIQIEHSARRAFDGESAANTINTSQWCKVSWSASWILSPAWLICFVFKAYLKTGICPSYLKPKWAKDAKAYCLSFRRATTPYQEEWDLINH